MNELVKTALRESICDSLQVLRKLTPQYNEPYQRWTKEAIGRWRGQSHQRTSVCQLFKATTSHLQKAGSHFIDNFLAEYPQYGKEMLVGLSGMSSVQLTNNKAYLLQSLLNYLWERHGTFNCSESQVEAVVSEFAEFIDSKTVRVRYWSQLLNFRMPVPKLALADNLTIRMLDEHEITELYGSSVYGGMPWQHEGIHEFVIEGEIETLKTISGKPDVLDNPLETVRLRLNQVIRCLRTFKEGRVGIYWCHFRSVNFCPLPMGSHGFPGSLTPFGSYVISDDEVPLFQSHSRNIIQLNESALETACARLTDAEARDRFQDQILDAVIGMEAVLLSGLANSDRRGELKFRFSLNYSTLFDSAEHQWAAYKIAKDLYDLRSKIAHGGALETTLRIGAEKLTLDEAAKKAKESLRALIRLFLDSASNAPYKKPDYWEKGYFGLRDLD